MQKATKTKTRTKTTETETTTTGQAGEILVKKKERMGVPSVESIAKQRIVSNWTKTNTNKKIIGKVFSTDMDRGQKTCIGQLGQRVK